jgi:HEAT repeat protein
MNQILKWLSGGDLRSDGMSDEVAQFILENPSLFDELFEGLHISDDVIRGRTANALEKVAREKPDLFETRIPVLLQVIEGEIVPLAKMHLAMILGHLVVCGESIEDITMALLKLSDDESAFTRSWAIVSLSIVVKQYPENSDRIFERLIFLQEDPSAAVRTRARKAMTVLGEEGSKLPKGWIKSKHLQDF